MKGKENAEQKAYRLIIHDIKTKCQPGDFLLERDLAERFGVSRTPVTIALNRLVAEGLLQKLPKKGCFIPNLNYDDARAAFSVRILLECEAARCAAQNAQAEDLLEMERILAATEEAIDTDNFLSFTFRDEDFHHALVQASDNLYTRFFDRLYTRKTPLKSGTLAEHTAIFNALGHNDTELAVSLVEKHCKDALSYVTNS